MTASLRAVGRLDDPAGHPLGTGFAVASTWALTAFHCVGDRQAVPPVLRHRDVRLVAGSQVLVATVEEYDPWLDVALLELAKPLPPGIQPIPLGCDVIVGSRFEAFGYPGAAEDAELEGWAVGGSVTSVLMRFRDAAPVIAVYVEGLDHRLPMQGISGGPVLVGQETQRSVGVLRYTVLADEQTGVALGDTLFATPAAAIAARFPVLRPHLELPERERQRRATLGSLLRTDIGPDGLLPPLATADPYTLGIPRAAPVVAGAPDRYIERAADDEIRRALKEQRFVVVKGEAKSGKSRTAIEAVRALYPESSLIAPRQRCRAVARIVKEDLLPRDSSPLVVWLDELAGFLAPKEKMDQRLISQLLERYPGALIVGTALGKDLSRLRSADLTRTAREVLEGATEVFLPAKPTQAERVRASELYPDEDFSGSTGIAERLIAAPGLIKRFDDAEDRAGWCLVMAAVDWWRMGPASPAPESLLRALAGHYRDSFFRNLEIDDNELRTGLRWAEMTVGSTEALLNVVDRTPERTYRPFDPLRAHASKRPDIAAVLTACWTTAITMATPSDLISIAQGAVDADDKRVTAKHALQKALESDDADSAEWAALFLGELEVQDGNTKLARELLTRAANADNETFAGLANVDLGALLMNTGERDQARALLEAVIGSGDPLLVPMAQANLGALLLQAGERDRARELLEAVIGSGDPLLVPTAQANLGALLMQAGEPDRVRELLEAAVGSGDPQAVPMAQANLGALLMNSGEPDRARELLEAAVGSGNPQAVPLAQANLGALLMNSGEPDRARELLEAAVGSGNALGVPLAQANLGALLMNSGEPDRARELLEAAVGSGNPQAVPLAQAILGALLMNSGEPDRARELLEAAVGSGNPLLVPLAQANLGALLMNSGEPDRARELLEAAVGSGNALGVPLAQAILGGLLIQAGEPDRARELLEAAVGSGNPLLVPMAQANLGALLMNSGEPDRARELLEAAVGSGNPQAVPTAQANLGALLMNSGEPDRARELLEAAVGSGDPQAVPTAQANLGALLMNSGEPDRGRELLEAAVGSGNPQAVPTAQANLGALLMNSGEPDRARELLEAAVGSGNPLLVPTAQANLGAVLMQAGEPDRGRGLLEAAVGSGNPQAVPMAQANLGALLMNSGEPDRARELLEAAVGSGDPQAVPMAQANLGAVLMQAGEPDRGRGLLEAAVGSGNPQAVPMAQANLGALLMNSGEPDRARELLEAAVGSGNPLLVPMAQANLGAVLMQAGEPDRGRGLLEAAVGSGNPQAVPMAQANLGALLMNSGEPDPARELLEAAVGSGDPQAVPLAQANLGALLMNSGEPDPARELLEAAVGSGNPQVVPMAHDLLGGLLAGEEDWAGAEAAYQAAIDTADPYWTPTAQLDLAMLRQRRGDTGGARELLEAAVGSGNPQVVPRAQANLGALLMQAGEPDRARELLEAAVGSGNLQVVPRAHDLLGELLADEEDWAARRLPTRRPLTPLIRTGRRPPSSTWRICAGSAMTPAGPSSWWKPRSGRGTRWSCRGPRVCSGACWLMRRIGPARRLPTRRPLTPLIRTGRRPPSSTWRICAGSAMTPAGPSSWWKPRSGRGTRWSCRGPRVCSGACWLMRRIGPARRLPTRRPLTPLIRTGRRPPSSTWRVCAGSAMTPAGPSSWWKPRSGRGTRWSCRGPRICSGACWLMRRIGPARRLPTRRPLTPLIRTGRRPPSSTWRVCAGSAMTPAGPSSWWKPRSGRGTRWSCRGPRICSGACWLMRRIGRARRLPTRRPLTPLIRTGRRPPSSTWRCCVGRVATPARPASCCNKPLHRLNRR